MCGFLAEFCFQSQQTTTKNKFEELLVLSKHRGPDATQIYSDSFFQLGFNRLAILDLSVNGNQPKASPSGKYQVVFNGEIYNFKELAVKYNLKDLSSTSDTEVLVHLFDTIGIERTIQELNGMFAIAAIDTQAKKIHLTRDFAGVKPLFFSYEKFGKGVVVASQFDQIFNHEWLSANLKLRPEIMKEYFGFGYMQAPNTIYENIFQVLPGELISFNQNGDIESKQVTFFEKFPTKEIEDTENTAVRYNEILNKIVKRQLISDVPIATFLSGGVDSPLITAHAKKLNADINALTLDVDDQKLSEAQKAISYAKHMKLSHEIVRISSKDIVECVNECVKKCPEPFGDYSILPTYILTKKAREKYTVMLSGDGGDELFHGYPRLNHVLDNKYLFSIPLKVRRPLIKLLNKLNIIDTPAPYYYNTLTKWQLAKHEHIYPDMLDDMFGQVTFSREFLELYEIEDAKTKSTLVDALQFNEFYAHLQRVLVKVDRASMANSLEVRVPFLDKESIDFSWKLNSNFLEHRILKKLLKDCLQKLLPKTIINQKKMGFTVPIDSWLKNELKEDVKYHVFELPFYGSDCIDDKKVRQYVRYYYDNKSMGPWGVWHIYMWQKWASVHMNKCL